MLTLVPSLELHRQWTHESNIQMNVYHPRFQSASQLAFQRTFLLGATSVRLSWRYVMSLFTDTKYLRWASLFMIWATFFDEIRSRPVPEEE